MKKAMSLLLALVLCVGLGVPAFAHPMEAADTDAAASVESPQYLVYKESFQLYIGSLTYANMVFTISEKGGSPAFESLDSISFTPIDTSSVYWNVTKHQYQLSRTECTLTIWRTEMLAGAPTGFSDTATFTIQIGAVVNSARESRSDIASSVDVIVRETYGIRMTAGELDCQVATSGIESATRVPMHHTD